MENATNVERTTGWILPGAQRDRQSVTADWNPVGRTLIDGVEVREARSVPKRSGLVTELYRADWFAAGAGVGQVFVVRLHPGGISAWHAHAHTIDRLSVVVGAATVVLFDARPGSPTLGLVNEFHLDERRPTTIVVPPQVWHGVQNGGGMTSLVANMPDRPYRYEDPDHWRVPPDSPHVPYSFPATSRVTEAI
jgi:dTDP-4-dehydrorhamnose 3,5-epimerase